MLYDNPFLPVRKERLYTIDGRETSRFAVFVRDTDADNSEWEAGQVSENYQLVENQEVFNTALDVLTRSKLEFNTGKMRFDGKRYKQSWTIPSLSVEPRKGDVVQLSLDAVNSYDASTMFGLQFNASRLVCLNGMMVDFILGEHRIKHLANSDNYQTELQLAAERIVNLQNALPGLTNIIQQMMNTRIDREFIQNMFSNLKFGQQLTGQIYMNIEEDNAWGLYNACTQVLTEKNANHADSTNRQVGRYLKNAVVK